MSFHFHYARIQVVGEMKLVKFNYKQTNLETGEAKQKLSAEIKILEDCERMLVLNTK